MRKAAGASSLRKEVCKSCGKEWNRYRGGSYDWEYKDCHKCHAKEVVAGLDFSQLGTVKKDIKIDIIEELASIEHEQWMTWAKSILETEDISEERKNRWELCFIPYNELTEEQKEQDRIWARKVKNILEEKK